MKNSGYSLVNKLVNTLMVAFSLSVIIFAGCSKKDAQLSSSNDITTSSNDIITSASTTAVTADEDSASLYTGTNQLPIAKAGPDQTYDTPVSSITLDGSGSSDPDGYIRSYLWTKDSGPGGVTISSPFSATTNVAGLVAGEYRFKLRVRDNHGATVTDTIHISNGGASSLTNQAPVVDAGSNQTITLPTSSVTLSGSATDADGTIASYLWTKTSGIGGLILNPNSASTSVVGLVAGSYQFNLEATDNDGATNNKTVTVTVNAALLPPPPPVNYGTLIYSTGYNTVIDLDPFDNGQWGAGTLADHLSTTIYKTGPGSFKSLPADVSQGDRSEVQYPESLTPTEGAIEYDVMYETVFQNYGHSLQFHPNTSGGSASPGLWHENGKFTLVNWKDGENTKYPTNFTIPQNQWMHVVFEYKMGSAGYMKFTIDGVVVLNVTNIQVGDGSGQYLKVGVNMWANQTSTVYYDNLKIWEK